MIKATISVDTARFKQEFSSSITKLHKHLNGVIKDSIKHVTSNIINMTPIKTGYLKGNWQASINSFSNTPVAVLDKAGTYAKSQVFSRLVSYDALNKDFYFYNVTPYGLLIEYGSSSQSPAGMVRVNVAQWPHIIDKYARTPR